MVLLNYAGVPCEMNSLLKIAQQHKLLVVEDNAHGLFARYQSKPLGTFGHLAIQSFHETKNLTCGEGGCLLVNDPSLIERAEMIRELGTNRKKFYMGQVDKYTWVDFGSSFLISDILAAYLFAQLEEADTIQAKRKKAWEAYHLRLKDWAARHDVRILKTPSESEHSYHMFYLILPTPQKRDALIAHLNRQGIGATFHYPPLHLSKMGQQFGSRPGDCPVSENVSSCLIRLPLYGDLQSQEIDQVVDQIRALPL
jgi:dTDP-4-amino-4,6-dideoxygalactose transaminase